jgi:prevent-host-death family protein
MNVSIHDARNRLSTLVAEAERGREVIITRRGVAVAKLVPIGAGIDRAKAVRAAEGLRRVSQGTTRELIDEGRS